MVYYQLFANVNPLEPNCMALVSNSRSIMCSSDEGILKIMTQKFKELKEKGYSVALYKITEEVIMTEKSVSLI